jgi:hypothetical protein
MDASRFGGISPCATHAHAAAGSGREWLNRPPLACVQNRLLLLTRQGRSTLTQLRAGQACSGGSAGPEPPDASGAILFSQQLRHSTCGRWCRPCSCSHATCAAPPTSSRSRPPPKRSPGTLGIRRSTALGIRRSTAIHLPIDKAARSWPIAPQAAKSSVTPPGRAEVQDQPTLLGQARRAAVQPVPRTPGGYAGIADVRVLGFDH